MISTRTLTRGSGRRIARRAGVATTLACTILASSTSITVASTGRDAVSRELVTRKPAPGNDRSTRELVLRRSSQAADVVSREIVFVRASGARDVVAREVSVNQLAHFTVPAGFLARQHAALPTGPAQWMSLAVQPAPVFGHVDLYVAVTTGQQGTPSDPPDDHLFRVDRGSTRVHEVMTFASAATDPIDLAFGGGAEFGSDLFVLSRNLDGGSILRVTIDGLLFAFGAAPVLTGPPVAMVVTPAASAFGATLCVLDDGSLGPSLVALSANAQPTGFVADDAAGFECAALAPDGDFGADVYAATIDGRIVRIDALGTVHPFAPPLGSQVQAIDFSRDQGFGRWLYVLLADGRVQRIDASGNVEPFLAGLLTEPVPGGTGRNDLTFGPHGDLLYVSDVRRGVVYTVQAALPTASPLDPTPPIPVRPVVHVHPNPFNPRTTIRFEIAVEVAAHLDIVDLRGRIVRRLIAGERLRAGEHERVWDGRDDRGGEVASGVYLVRLSSGSPLAVAKVVLLR